MGWDGMGWVRLGYVLLEFEFEITIMNQRKSNQLQLKP